MPYRVKTDYGIKSAKRRGKTAFYHIRHTHRWHKLREFVIRRDQVCCDVFGLHPNEFREIAEVHHIESVARCPERGYDADNLAGLCFSCHKLVTYAEAHCEFECAEVVKAAMDKMQSRLPNRTTERSLKPHKTRDSEGISESDAWHDESQTKPAHLAHRSKSQHLSQLQK